MWMNSKVRSLSSSAFVNLKKRSVDDRETELRNAMKGYFEDDVVVKGRTLSVQQKRARIREMMQ